MVALSLTTMRGFKPVTSRLIARKERRKERRMHEKRLQAITNRKSGARRKAGAWVDSGFDNGPPKTVGMRHLAVNAKRERMIEERCEEIERQNKLLLARMTQIMSSKGVFKRTTEVPPPGPRSLNIGVRRKELMRIVTDNEKILSRINSVEPQYSVKQWEQDFEKMATIRESLSNFYPDEFGNDAEATDAMKAAAGEGGGEGGGGGGGGGGGSRVTKAKQSAPRSASAARSREKKTRLDRVLLVSRERPGRYAAERPKGAAASNGGGGGRRGRPSRGQSASTARRKPPTSSVVYTSTAELPMKPNPPKESTKVVGGGRGAAVTAQAAKMKEEEEEATTTTPEAMSAGLLMKRDEEIDAQDAKEAAEAKKKSEEKEEEEELKKKKKKAAEKAAEAERRVAEEKEKKDDKAAADKAKAASDKAASDKAASDKAATDKAASDKVASDKAAADKAASDKAAADKAAADKAAADKAVADKAAADQATSAEIEEDISTVERRWDGDIAFTQQEFVDFYGGLDEWSVATVVLPGELEHHEESEEVISQDVTSLNLERTMGKLPLDWTMSANCKINGEPLSEQIYKNLAAALQDVSSKCGGINEYDNGTFQLMKFGQAIISATGMTAYVSPTA